jgi:hypothetical protein
MEYPQLSLKKRFLSDNQCRFLLANGDLPLIFYPGVEIIAYETESGLLAIGMIIDETATDVSKKEALVFMNDWQERLIQWQGSHNPKFLRDDVVGEAFQEYQNKGVKATDVAKKVNDTLYYLLLCYGAFIQKIRFHQYKFRTLGDYFDWFDEHENDLLTIKHRNTDKKCRLAVARTYQTTLHHVLMDFSNDRDETAKIIAQAIQKVLEYKVPFTRRYPITQSHVYKTFDRYKDYLAKQDNTMRILHEHGDIPDIFDDWSFGVKLQWGRDRGNIDKSVRDKEFIFEAFVDPFSVLD